MTSPLTRRAALQVAAGSLLASASASLAAPLRAAERALSTPIKGRVRHSVCKWCYQDVPLETLCQAAEEIGLESIELLKLPDFAVLQKYGLQCAMVDGVPGGIGKGLNRVEHHDAIVAFFEEALPVTAKAGFPAMICFSGNREGMSDDQGMENCVKGLKRIAPIAERHGVTVCMELLNSRINHPDYMCDRTPWGAEVCKQVGSERVKLLYDIYHMQIMEGDLIHTIRENHPYIGHYHTGGVPGRNEIDASQEIYYPAVMEAIVATGYKGYVGQEFIPKKADKLASLAEGVRICDI